MNTSLWRFLIKNKYRFFDRYFKRFGLKNKYYKIIMALVFNKIYRLIQLYYPTIIFIKNWHIFVCKQLPSCNLILDMINNNGFKKLPIKINTFTL